MLTLTLPVAFDRLYARIGFDQPLSELTRGFVDGVVRNSVPRATVSLDYQGVSTALAGEIAEPGDVLPVIHMRNGYTNFGVADWGRPETTASGREFFHQARTTGVGNPGLIPLSFIDIWTAPASGKVERSPVRLRAASGLFLACQCWSGIHGQPGAVTPLVKAAGERIMPFSDWEPVFVHISPEVRLENWDFLMRRDNGRLQMDSPSVLIEPLAVPELGLETVNG
jgi:hypothetical protein